MSIMSFKNYVDTKVTSVSSKPMTTTYSGKTIKSSNTRGVLSNLFSTDYDPDEMEKIEKTKREIREYLTKKGISKEYQEELIDLYIDLSNSKSYSSVRRKLKDWAKETDIPLAEVLNKILKGESKLDFKFTDDFLDKHFDSIVDLLDLSLIKDGSKDIFGIYDLLNTLEVGSDEEKLKKLSSKIRKLKNINISYDELETQIPNLNDYLINNLDIEGANVTEETLRNLWNSITFNKTILAIELNQIYFEKREQILEQIKDTPSFYEAVLDFYPELPKKLKNYINENTDLHISTKIAKKLLRKGLRKMVSKRSFTDDLFYMLESIESDSSIDALKQIVSFCWEYDIDFLELTMDYIDFNYNIIDALKWHVSDIF